MEQIHVEGRLGDVAVSLSAESQPYCVMYEHSLKKTRGHCSATRKNHESNYRFHPITTISTRHSKMLGIN